MPYVVGAGVLTSRFNQSANQLADQRESLDGQIRQSITDINGYADQIADLNAQIAGGERGTARPSNDF
ncbi:MAG: hypothetical protein U0231_15555 [Nitrospiraceae bacterium]